MRSGKERFNRGGKRYWKLNNFLDHALPCYKGVERREGREEEEEICSHVNLEEQATGIVLVYNEIAWLGNFVRSAAIMLMT